MPATWAMAIEPSHRIEVRLTNTYSASQNTAISVRMRLPYRSCRNCGMVVIWLRRKIGRNHLPTISRVSAAIHS
jgi:hypothetical protein